MALAAWAAFCLGGYYGGEFQREAFPVHACVADDMGLVFVHSMVTHPVLLPVGEEGGQFTVSKDILDMKIPDGDRKKRRYQVVAVKPIDHSVQSEPESTKYDASPKNYPDKASR